MESKTKICKTCKIEKSVDDFQKAGGGKWLQPYCKSCDDARKKVWSEANKERLKQKRALNYEANKEVILAKQKEYSDSNKGVIKARSKKYRDENKEAKRLSDKRYVENNREKVLQQKKEYYKANADAFREYGKERRKCPEYKAAKAEKDRAYRNANREKITARKKIYYDAVGLEQAKAWQAKMKDDVEFVTKKRLRGRIYVALKRGIKSKPTMDLLGCTIDFFKEYFQSLFTEGMTWEKYMSGGIVIDHIKPCKLFDLSIPDQQKECFNYKNLQPLWELDNLKKGVFFQEKQVA